MNTRTRVIDPVSQVEYEVPAFSTPTETLAHHAKARDGLLRVIRVFSEHGSGDSLWEDDSEAYRLAAEDLGLSAPLTRALRVWQTTWVTTAPGAGDASSRERWLIDGCRIVDRPREELWGTAEVHAEFG